MWVIPKFNAKITKTLEGLKRNGVSLCSKKKKKLLNVSRQADVGVSMQSCFGCWAGGFNMQTHTHLHT